MFSTQTCSPSTGIPALPKPDVGSCRQNQRSVTMRSTFRSSCFEGTKRGIRLQTVRMVAVWTRKYALTMKEPWCTLYTEAMVTASAGTVPELADMKILEFRY